MEIIHQHLKELLGGSQMICYRDRSFCGVSESCIYKSVCERVLTQEMLEEAKRLNLPISYFADTPMCYFGSSKQIAEESK